MVYESVDHENDVNAQFVSLSISCAIVQETCLRKQPALRDPTTNFTAKWRLRNACRNSLLMTCHNPDLDSASDWLRQISFAARPIRSTTQIWVVSRHQYGISVVVSQTSFRGETSGTVAKCRLISQANPVHVTVKKKTLTDHRNYARMFKPATWVLNNLAFPMVFNCTDHIYLSSHVFC